MTVAFAWLPGLGAAVLGALIGTLSIVGAVVTSMYLRRRLSRYRGWWRKVKPQKRVGDQVEALKRAVADMEDTDAYRYEHARTTMFAAERELKMADLALNHGQLYNALLHAKIGIQLVSWAENLAARDEEIDSNGVVTTALLKGLEQLSLWQLPEAEEILRQICDCSRVNFAARRIALRAHSWILDAWGMYKEAESEAMQVASILGPF